MTDQPFTVEIADKIAHVRLSRPEKANAMAVDFWNGFPGAIQAISDEGAARVIVLSAEGDHFSSGMDISVFMAGALDHDAGNPQLSAEVFRHKARALQDAFNALEEARQPVLAACQGAVIGAGLDLVTAADCRYAAANAFFCVEETAIGMTADVGTFPRLAKVVAEGWARQMAYTAERMPAETAKAIGLVNDVFATPEETLAAVMEIAARIARNSPLAVAGSKRMLNYARDHSTRDALDYVATWNAGMLRPEDIREAFEAKMAKRQPQFADLKRVTKLG